MNQLLTTGVRDGTGFAAHRGVYAGDSPEAPGQAVRNGGKSRATSPRWLTRRSRRSTRSRRSIPNRVAPCLPPCRGIARHPLRGAVGRADGGSAGLALEDVDLDRGELRVTVALQRRKGSKEPVEPKTEQFRRTLSPLSVLLAALKTTGRASWSRASSGWAWKCGETRLCSPPQLERRSDFPYLTRHYKEMLKRAGLPDIRFHDLRHTAASLLVAQGVHPRVVMEILEHSQIGFDDEHLCPCVAGEPAGGDGAHGCILPFTHKRRGLG